MCIFRPHNLDKYKIDGCFVDSNDRFAFIHIYKNASISLRNALGMRGKYFKYNDVKNKKLKTITIIRNPIDRAISMYLYLLRLEDNNRPNQHPVQLTKKCCFYKKREHVLESFMLFLDTIYGGNFYDAVTYPQVNFLSDRGLNINCIDEVFIQKNLFFEFKLFIKKYKLDFDFDFPKDNIGDEEKKKIIKEYINTNFFVKYKIMNIYAADIEMYNLIVYKKNKNLII